MNDLLPPSPLSAVVVLVCASLIFAMRTYDRLRRRGRSAPIAGIESLIYSIAWVGSLWLLLHTLDAAFRHPGR